MAMITGLRFGHVNAYYNNVSPRGARRYAPPAADGSSTLSHRFAVNQAISTYTTRTLKSRRIYVRLRTGPQSAHLWWPAVAKLQAARAPKA